MSEAARWAGFEAWNLLLISSGVLSLDRLGNGLTEDVQERFDVEIVGSPGIVKGYK